MNESLQEPKTQLQPIWAMANNFKQHPGSLTLLDDYANAFKENRGLNTTLKDVQDPLDALENLLKLSVAQFAPGESRNEINLLYIRAVESELCSHFVQSRGRAGRVSVFNQDYLILLTNLAIGEQDKLRFLVSMRSSLNIKPTMATRGASQGRSSNESYAMRTALKPQAFVERASREQACGCETVPHPSKLAQHPMPQWLCQSS